MRIYTSGSILIFLAVLPYFLKYFYPVPESIFLNYLYGYLAVTLILSTVLSLFLLSSPDTEKRRFFLATTLFLFINILAFFYISYTVAVGNEYVLRAEDLSSFTPLSSIACLPVLTYAAWKIGRERRYLDFKHFIGAVITISVILTHGTYTINQLSLENLSLNDYLHITAGVLDIVTITLFVILLSMYYNTVSAVYYVVIIGHYVLKYLGDTFLLYSQHGLVDPTYPILYYMFSMIPIFSGFLYIYKQDIRLLSYYEVDLERRRYAELYRKVNEFQEVLKLINRMLRHDVLNKLQIISGYIETYMMTKNDSLLEKALKAVDDSSMYIDKIRELEKIVSTETDALKPVNVRDLVEEVIRSYNIQFNIHGWCVAMANEALYSVIDNIISNAIKHGGTEKIDIWLSEVEDECEIRIADYGAGIPSEIKEQVFKESFKFGEQAGTGLGLYIVKKVVDRYGGKVWIEDSKPHGATFVIRLKAARKSLNWQ